MAQKRPAQKRPAQKRPAACLELDSEESLTSDDTDYTEEFEEENLMYGDDPAGNVRKLQHHAVRSVCCQAISTVRNPRLKFEDGDKKKIEKAVDKLLVWLSATIDDEALRGINLTKDKFEAKQKELADVVNPIVHAALLKVPYGTW